VIVNSAHLLPTSFLTDLRVAASQVTNRETQSSLLRSNKEEKKKGK